jgi:hypothetical protein
MFTMPARLLAPLVVVARSADDAALVGEALDGVVAGIVAAGVVVATGAGAVADVVGAAVPELLDPENATAPAAPTAKAATDPSSTSPRRPRRAWGVPVGGSRWRWVPGSGAAQGSFGGDGSSVVMAGGFLVSVEHLHQPLRGQGPDRPDA